MNKNLEKYIDLYNSLQEFEKEKIPLCAAENYVSDFCKSPLVSAFEGKYSFIDSIGNDSFIGGKFVAQLNLLLTDECNSIFHATYTNADTLTGINCFTVCAMSLLTSKDYVLITTPEQGGHASIPVILNTLGVKYDAIPYDYKNYQIDYNALNDLCASGIYSFIVFCQSDIINPPNMEKINLPENMGIIYDGTQTLGLIASKIIPNPLDTIKNVVLIGGTHKTLPAPACGLIMTQNPLMAQKLKDNITPHYLRNTQPNHIASLLLALIEQEEIGQAYQSNVVNTANILGKELEKFNFKLAKISSNVYTMTHQLFILMTQKETEQFYFNAQKYNITLNKKHKLLFSNDGIRIGTQEIAQYNWNPTDLNNLAQLLFYIKSGNNVHNKIIQLRKTLISKKEPQFTYEKITIE